MAGAVAWTTKMLCDELAARKNFNTDYKLAKYMGVAQSSISLWRNAGRGMSDEWAARFAAELDLDPAYVCLCLAAERADAKMAGVMRTWLLQHGTAAAVAGTVFSAIFVLAALPASAFASGGLCILCSIADTGRRCLRRLIARSMLTFPDRPLVGLPALS